MLNKMPDMKRMRMFFAVWGALCAFVSLVGIVFLIWIIIKTMAHFGIIGG